MLLRDAEIIFNEPLSPRLYHMGLRSPEIAARIWPGQFLMLRVNPGFDPLLRRPFAVHRLCESGSRASFELLYRLVGRGTALLAEKQPGNHLSLFGPLGRGFQLPARDGMVVMVAGGIGIAPVPFLAETLVHSGHRGPFFLWFGARTAADLVCVRHFEKPGFCVELVTEDGSSGRQGLVTEELERWLLRQKERPEVIYSCGPYAMQRRVAALATRLGIPAQLSMEALMACGVGACLGCSLRCRGPDRAPDPYYANVCQQGPVFAADEIIWE